MRYLSIFVVFSFFSVGVKAQSIEGKWRTIDDESGKVKSVVNLYLKSQKLYGKVLEIYPDLGDPEDPICGKCKDYRKDEKVIGMEIISGLTMYNDEWKKDNGILDPENGKLYDCKIWLENKNKLAVRGYIGFFYRTQYWERVK